jgi:hypothetical protein
MCDSIPLGSDVAISLAQDIHGKGWSNVVPGSPLPD